MQLRVGVERLFPNNPIRVGQFGGLDGFPNIPLGEAREIADIDDVVARIAARIISTSKVTSCISEKFSRVKSEYSRFRGLRPITANSLIEI